MHIKSGITGCRLMAGGTCSAFPCIGVLLPDRKHNGNCHHDPHQDCPFHSLHDMLGLYKRHRSGAVGWKHNANNSNACQKACTCVYTYIVMKWRFCTRSFFAIPQASANLIGLGSGIALQVERRHPRNMGASHGSARGCHGSSVTGVHRAQDSHTRTIQVHTAAIVGVGPPCVCLV